MWHHSQLAQHQITGSWISDIKSTSQETQAIGGWNRPGPFVIENNYLEASGVNVMSGGARTSITGLVPSDIVFRKKLRDQAAFLESGRPYVQADQVVREKPDRTEECPASNHRQQHLRKQLGWRAKRPAFSSPVRSEVGAMPWAVIEDVRLSNNVLRNSEQAINMAGRDGSNGGAMRRVTISNNVF